MLTCRRYKSIHEIDPQHWNSILNEQDIFHRHSFISMVEDSRVENAGFSYLSIYDDEKLVATTVFSVFNVSLDLFISNNRLVRSLKKIFPGLFTIKILACGLPASFGQLNLKVTGEKYAAGVCALLAKEMLSMAKKKKIKFMTIKEAKEREYSLFSALEQHGFFPALSIPYMKMKLEWKSFEEYLDSLRHHYRRQIILSLKKTGRRAPVITPENNYDSKSPLPAWVLSVPDEKFADAYYNNYLRVMERTPTKLETLNQEFFRQLFHQKNKYKILSFVVQGKILSSAILVHHGDTLTFMLVAREKEKDEYDSYFNLLYGIMAFAIQHFCRRLHLGQTAYWVKQCIGAEAEKEFLWMASTSRFWHRLLKTYRRFIFPEMKLKKLRVFKLNKNRQDAQMVKQEAEKNFEPAE
jgi:predicted N-acyltransferase